MFPSPSISTSLTNSISQVQVQESDYSFHFLGRVTNGLLLNTLALEEEKRLKQQCQSLLSVAKKLFTHLGKSVIVNLHPDISTYGISFFLRRWCEHFASFDHVRGSILDPSCQVFPVSFGQQVQWTHCQGLWWRHHRADLEEPFRRKPQDQSPHTNQKRIARG